MIGIVIALIICLILGISCFATHVTLKTKHNKKFLVQHEELKVWNFLKNNVFLMLTIFFIFSIVVLTTQLI